MGKYLVGRGEEEQRRKMKIFGKRNYYLVSRERKRGKEKIEACGWGGTSEAL